MKISVVLMTLLLGTGMFVMDGACIIPKQEEIKEVNKTEEIHTTIETEGMFKGLKKTDMGTYIPESYEQVYECMKDSDYISEKEKQGINKKLYSWQEYEQIFADKNKIVKQGYPENTIVSPYLLDGLNNDYINYIIFTPNTTLDKTENERLGLTEQQYKVIYEDMIDVQIRTKEEELAKPSEIEVMNISCKYEELPSAIYTLTAKMPKMRPIDFAYTFALEAGKSEIEVCHNSGNEVYLYALLESGGFKQVLGDYFEEIGDDNMPAPVQVSEVEKIICMYMHPDYDRSAYCMVGKFVVFDIEK